MDLTLIEIENSQDMIAICFVLFSIMFGLIAGFILASGSSE